MSSLYDELSDKLAADPRLTKRSGPRSDIVLLLFNARDDIRDLYAAAELEVSAARDEGRTAPASLEAAIDKLRPIFGDRART